MKIIEALQTKDDLLHGKKQEKEIIASCEKELQIKFAADYYEYVSEFSVASYDGHELTGVTDIKRLNVVNATKRERSIHSNIPANCYVVEQTGIDDIVIWQDERGQMYYSKYKTFDKLPYGSLAEYILALDE